MLKTRIIPTLLLKNYGVVKGKGFDSWRRVGTLLPALRVYNMREVDELIVVDIMATAENRDPDYEEIRNVSGDCFVPLTVGGGVTNITQVTELLRAGADKVCINSAAFDNPELISEAAKRFGSQCVVASVDVCSKGASGYECYRACGKEPTAKQALAWCQELERLGAGEILLTSVERDGTMQGYDTDLISEVCHSVSIPVIASGGAGNYQHMHAAVKSGASAVAAAAMFHFTEQTPLEAKKYLASQGVAVRKPFLKGDS